jgi:5-methyltetrahydrofolate--homocysteine methyltransferase
VDKFDPPLPPLFKGGKKEILNRITSGLPLLFDGAIGSRLMQMGLEAGSPPEAWVLERPDQIEVVHREYVEAGSEVIATVTFGANRTRLKKCGLESQLAEINLRAVEIARATAGTEVFVAADLGPTGEFFQPLGNLTLDMAQEIYCEQAHSLAEAGVDFFLLETFYDLQEARICLAACKAVAPQIPVAASMTFKRTKRGFFTEMGNPAAESLRALHDGGAFLVGANCTLEAVGMVELARYLSQRIDFPLLYQPNAGSPQITPEGVVYPQQKEEFAECMAEIIRLGARAVGGCCGTEGSYIFEMKKRILETGHRKQEK